MKKLSITQMEDVSGGRISAQCGVNLGGAFIFGTAAVIGGMTGGLGWLAFGMADNYFGWGMAAWSCSGGKGE